MEFKNTKQLREWLSDPNNQIDSNVFIVRWKGTVPSISRSRLYLMDERGFLETVLIEHLRRKDPGSSGSFHE